MKQAGADVVWLPLVACRFPPSQRSSKLKVITKLDVTCPDTMPAGHISTDGSCMSLCVTP